MNPNPLIPKKKGQAAAIVVCRERGFMVGDVLISRAWRVSRTVVRMGARTVELKENMPARGLRSTLEWLPKDVRRESRDHGSA